MLICMAFGHQVVTSLAPRSTLTNVIPTGGAFDAREEQYFQVFRTDAASELSGCFDSEFWTRAVLQESHSEYSIRHAVVALGALYKTLKSAQNDSDGGFDSAPDHYNFALQQYGRGLSRLRESLTNNEPRSIRTVLISIIFFICFQSLIGDYNGAVFQIQHGLDLLQEHDLKRAQDSQRNDEVEDELVHIVKRLAVQAKFYDMVLHLPPPYRIRLTPALQERPLYQSSLSPLETVGTPSLSLEVDVPKLYTTSLEARCALSAICDHTIRLIEELSPDSSCSVHVPQLSQWSHAFAPLLERRRRLGVKIKERVDISSLKMIQLMASVLFQSPSNGKAFETYFDDVLAHFREIVELGKEITSFDQEIGLVQTSGDGAGNSAGDAIPSFTSEMCLIAPLFIVATKSRDRSTRREAIRLLLSRPRREGILDSSFCAKVANLIMEMEEGAMSSYDPWNQSASEQVPDEKRIVIKEIFFNLKGRTGTLVYERRAYMANEILKTGIFW